MSQMFIDAIGYGALLINLYSMSVKGEYKLRFISLIANIIYIFYGVLLNASPVIMGCAIAVLLHSYRLYKLKSTKTNCHDSN